MIIQGDCIEEMKKLPDNSVDAIVTDPPYELGFMGKHWDNSGIANNIQMWKEALRVLKSGGHLLSFGGTRTYHRMACAIEDAGFEIRDCIMWVYGSGFPKSLNIGKQIDKMNGTQYPKNEKISDNDPMSGGNYTRHTISIQNESAKKFEGWGTALKPAVEPIVLARKPLSEKNVASNVLKWGTGGINIDGCRIGTEERLGRPQSHNLQPTWRGLSDNGFNNLSDKSGGRFPANFIHDGSDEVLDLFPESKISGSAKLGKLSRKGHKTGFIANGISSTNLMPNDSGSAARFFYCAKASKSERNFGLDDFEKVIRNDGRDEELESGDMPQNRSNNPKKNHHPTIKPIKLMQYLVRLVTPKCGIVLDPFTGSGTTGIACVKEGMQFIGIEREEEYIKIAEARIKPFLEQEKLT